MKFTKPQSRGHFRIKMLWRLITDLFCQFTFAIHSQTKGPTNNNKIPKYT